MKNVSYWVPLLLVLHPLGAFGQVVMDQASTVGESYARGASDIIRSQGVRNLANSQAAINLTDARSQQIDNQVASVNAYWEKKGIYEQHQQEKNYKIAAQRQRILAKYGLKSLTPDQFDRTTGKITWLGPLNAPQYEKYRNEMDSLFTKRAKEGWLSSSDYLAAQTVSKEWRAELTKEQGDYPKNVLSQMLRFILKLNRELDENVS